MFRMPRTLKINHERRKHHFKLHHSRQIFPVPFSKQMFADAFYLRRHRRMNELTSSTKYPEGAVKRKRHQSQESFKLKKGYAKQLLGIKDWESCPVIRIRVLRKGYRQISLMIDCVPGKEGEVEQLLREHVKPTLRLGRAKSRVGRVELFDAIPRHELRALQKYSLRTQRGRSSPMTRHQTISADGTDPTIRLSLRAPYLPLESPATVR